jgi:hypothetical protein
MLERAWGLRKEYYLGDWHFHPFSPPNPSADDYDQMLRIASSPNWKCPEPVLLIIGGDPHRQWRPYGLVTTRRGERFSLIPDEGYSHQP